MQSIQNNKTYDRKTKKMMTLYERFRSATFAVNYSYKVNVLNNIKSVLSS